MSGENDLLERATRSLRATPPPSQDELAAARARLMSAQRGANKSSRARALRWVLPLAAVLAAGSALAATPGQLERVTRAVTQLFATAPSATEKAKKLRARSARPAPLPAVAPKAEAAVEPAVAPQPTPVEPPTAIGAEPNMVPAPSVAEQRLRDQRRRLRAERSARGQRASTSDSTALPTDPARAQADQASAVPVAPAPEPLPNRDLALYREAHQQHFRARDFVAALRAWESYLNEFPSGTFAIEARYNRAICLVRLDRKPEARRALSPFARGEVARGYRKAEAAKLLEALE